jgi:hypothetical protein
MSVTHRPEPLTVGSVLELRLQRLGERTCVITVGTDLRHTELPRVVDAAGAVLRDGCHDLVFDLTYMRHYEPFALVRLAREWDRMAADGCAIHVAARDPHVVDDLERLAGLAELQGWELHRSTTRALRALLSAPVA